MIFERNIMKTQIVHTKTHTYTYSYIHTYMHNYIDR